MRNGRGYGGGGIGKGMGRGGGGGGGRGQGMGQGRGGGRKMGRCQERSPTAGFALSATKPRDVTQEAQALKAQAQHMMNQLGAITHRIVELEAGSVDSSASVERRVATARCDERSTFPKMKAVIDRGQCTCCGLCVDICPERAITMNADVTVDSNRCTGCGSCVDECPSQAISLLLSAAVPRVAMQGL